MYRVNKVKSDGSIYSYKAHKPTCFTKAKCYILCRKHKYSGDIECLAELSFSMTWCKTHAKVYVPYYFEHPTIGVMRTFEVSRYKRENADQMDQMVKRYSKNPDFEYFKARVGSKKCPVKLNWVDYHTNGTRYRNVKITFK